MTVRSTGSGHDRRGEGRPVEAKPGPALPARVSAVGPRVRARALHPERDVYPVRPPVTRGPHNAPYWGQIQPLPLGFGKQPTDCGSSCFGSHSTTSGKSTVNAIVMKNTM